MGSGNDKGVGGTGLEWLCVDVGGRQGSQRVVVNSFVDGQGEFVLRGLAASVVVLVEV